MLNTKGTAQELLVFTDGAYNGIVSSWAFAVIGVTSQGNSLLGWARGAVALPGEAHHIGATGHTALEGERSALFWAVAWILQGPSATPTRVKSDCLVAAGQARGNMSNHAEPGTAEACRAITQAAEATGKLIVSR